MEGVGEDTPHRQGRGGEGPAGPVWVARQQQCRVSCLYSSYIALIICARCFHFFSEFDAMLSLIDMILCLRNSMS